MYNLLPRQHQCRRGVLYNYYCCYKPSLLPRPSARHQEEAKWVWWIWYNETSLI